MGACMGGEAWRRPPPLHLYVHVVHLRHPRMDSTAGMYRGEARTGHGLLDYACHVAIRSPAERTSPRHCGLPLLLLIFGGSRRALPLCGGAGAASNSRRSRRAAKSEREQLTEPEKTFWNNCSKGEPMTTNAKNASKIGPNGVLLPWRCGVRGGFVSARNPQARARAQDSTHRVRGIRDVATLGHVTFVLLAAERLLARLALRSRRVRRGSGQDLRARSEGESSRQSHR